MLTRANEPGLSRLAQGRLEALLESAQLLHGSLNLEQLLGHLLRVVMGRLLVGRAAIAVNRDGTLTVALSRGAPSLKPGAPFTLEAAADAGLDRQLVIGSDESPVGCLAMARPLRGELDEEDRAFLHALLGLAATGIANAQAHEQALRSNRLLDQKVEELRAVVDLGRGLAATLDPDEIAQLLMLTLSGRWMLRRYGLATWHEGHPAIVRQRGIDLSAARERRALITAMPDIVITGAESGELGLPIGSLVFPLRFGDSTFGIVACGPRAGAQPWTEADTTFGGGLVAQAAVAFNNAWYFRETLGKKQMEKELDLAAAIQQGLFPSRLPDLAGTDIAARNRQARQVGGDYYDAIPVAAANPRAPHLLCVIDISGKGLFASILMSNLQATLRAQLEPGLELGALTARTNDLLHAATPANRYATGILAVYDPATGVCHWVNCAHNDGVLLRASGEVELVQCTGLALGMFPRQEYEKQTLVLGPGDLLAMCSDGVPDAINTDEVEFGMERFIDCLRRHTNVDATGILDAVFSELDAWVGEAPQFDDITLMIVKRTL